MKKLLLILSLSVLPLMWVSCEAPPAGEEPAIDLRSRDITWPTLDGRTDRPAEPALPLQEEVEEMD